MKYKKLLDRLNQLLFYQDKKIRHPEENILEHSKQAFILAKKESNNINLHIAALFHDIGKQIETYGHEEHSIEILECFGYYNKEVFYLIKNHIRVVSFLNGEMNALSKVQDMLNHKYFKNLIHLRRIDYKARNPNKVSKIDINEINTLLEITNERDICYMND